MTIQTIYLQSNEVKTIRMKAHYLAIKNQGTDILYASKKADITPDADDVLSIETGDSTVLPIWNDTAYIQGSGKVVIMGSSKCEDFFKPIVDEATDVRAIRSNMLVNPNFAVNQRKVSGTVSAPADIVDRWELTEGTVTITDSGLVLDGTISQTLDAPVGIPFATSSNAGTASYDDTTGTFSINADNELITYAKLEKGIAPSDFQEPNYMDELAKCYRYLVVLSQYVRYPNTLISEDVIDFNITLPVTLRSIPTIDDLSKICIKSSVGNAEEGFTFDILTVSGNTIVIRGTKASHGLTRAYLELTEPLQLKIVE